MSSKYYLTIHIPFFNEDEILLFEKHLLTRSYNKVFWHSIAPPHNLEYVFGPLTEIGVENFKDHWRSYCEHFDEETKKRTSISVQPKEG